MGRWRKDLAALVGFIENKDPPDLKPIPRRAARIIRLRFVLVHRNGRVS